MWIALKAQKVQRDGKLVDIKPGDPVPEAETWPNRPVWIRTGYIRWVERTESKPKKVKARETKVGDWKKDPVSVEVVEPKDEVPESKPKAKSKKTKKDDS